MDMLMLAAATPVEEDRGWGGPIALLVGLGLFVALIRGPRWIGGWLDRRAAARDELDDVDSEDLDDEDVPARPSPRWLALARSIRDAVWDRGPLPSPGGGRGHDGGVTEVTVGSDPTGDPSPDRGGDPSDDPDVALHGDIVEDAQGRRYRAYRPSATPMRSALATERRPYAAGPDPVDEGDETIAEYVRRRLGDGAIDDEGRGYRALVREVMRVYGVSEATARRRVKDARTELAE